MRRTLVLFCTASLVLAVGTKAQTPREVLLTTDNAYNPIPGPDGKYVAYVRIGWGRGAVTGFGRASLVSDVKLTEVDGAPTATLLAEDFFLSGWTPDGTRAVCFRDGRYALVSTERQQTMTGLIPNDPGRYYDPTEWVAYLPTLATLVWSRRVDGSHDAIETPGTPIAQEVASGAQRVVPSPDGRYLAVFPQSLRGELRIYDLHSKSWSDLGSMTVHPDKDWSYIQPDWSPWFPDGSRLVFLRDSTLVIDGPDGNTKTEISVDGPAGIPVPSPDGDRVAYVTFEPRPMKMRYDLRFWGGTTIWVASATAGSRPRAATEKNVDEVYDLKWLNNETLVFDRIADEVFYRHARIWKASVPH